jgi:SecD/SecF fusion protein
MKRFAWKIALIVGFTLAGLFSMWPPDQKLKLGIDLSGGTILV